MSERKPWTFCEREGNQCTMNMCDEYGCQEREPVLVEPTHLDIIRATDDTEICKGCEREFNIETMRMDDEDGNWWCRHCLGDESKSKN